MPIEQIDLKGDAPILFRHPSIDRQLHIGTGISGISWPYELNTQATPTYGGEVVQVLSAYVGAMTVHGQTTDNRQLRQIADWFLEYMQLAGLHNRDEHFITMEYPERGWSFWLQVTELPNFHYNIEELAVEWQIQAEIVADNDLNYLSQMTMSAYTETAFDPTMWDVRFMEHDKRNDPIHLDPSLGLKIGDNFQSLLGAWATGDFAHWALDATSDVSKNHLKNARDYWTQIYGSDTPFASSTGGGAGGSANLASAPGTSVVAIIANAFTAHGIPPELGVASAMAESGLDPDKYQEPVGSYPYHGTAVYKQTGAGLFQTTNVGGEEDRLYHLAINDQPHRITDKYPASKQAEFAAQRFAATTHSSNLGQWAWNAQRPKDQAAYVAEINANIPRAKQMIQASANAGGKLGAGGTPKARLAAEWALSQLGVPYVSGGESPGAGFDCSGLCEWAYAKAGVSIPRTSEEQFSFCHSVPLSSVVPGDLVFSQWPGDSASPGHVVMAIGNGKVVAAPSTGRNVQIESLSSFTGSEFRGAGRVPNA